MYKVFFYHKALRYYKHLDTTLKQRISHAIEHLKENPFKGCNVKQLSGELKGTYRLRVGEYRLIYEVDKSKSSIIIMSIGSRGDVYK